MAEGACAAQHSLALPFSVDYFDDRGLPTAAIKHAERIVRDPRYLAVVGHGTSATTKAAESIYAAANLPLVMPIATAADVCLTAAGRRHPQCLRLPPDDGVQGRALAYFVRRVATLPTDVVLIVDVSPHSREYSEPLAATFLRQFANFFPADRRFEIRDPAGADYAGYARYTDGHARLVVYIGYWQVLDRFLASLSQVPGAQSGQLTIIGTDGALSPLLNPRGLDLRITFPYPLRASDASPSGATSADQGSQELLSYQSAGFDAVSILAELSKQCAARLSRKCIEDRVHDRFSFVGRGTTYSFDGGERIQPRYFLLNLRSRAAGGFSFSRCADVSWEDLIVSLRQDCVTAGTPNSYAERGGVDALNATRP